MVIFSGNTKEGMERDEFALTSQYFMKTPIQYAVEM